MRPIAAFTLSAIAVLTTGCAGGMPGSSPDPSVSAAAPTSGGGPVAACVVGDWKSTDVKAEIGGPLGQATFTGGSGVRLSVASGGQTQVDFTGMVPVSFDVTAAGNKIKGQVAQSGKATGRIRTGDTTSTTGQWEPVGKTDWAAVRVTVELIEPVRMRPVDDVAIGEVLGKSDQTAGSVDLDPLLRKGKYMCGTTTLQIGSSDGNGMTWDFVKV